MIAAKRASLALEIPATRAALVKALASLRVLGLDRARVVVRSTAQFESGGDFVFAQELRLLAVNQSADFLTVTVDNKPARARPMSPTIGLTVEL